jgi:integration host factor subunit alpha
MESRALRNWSMEANLKALTKAKMADQLFEELGLNKREAKEIVELFFDEIRESLEHNTQVKLSGFGNFDLREKGERPGRNPKTGEEIPISARRVVTFRPGQKLKARVEAYAGKPQTDADLDAGTE